MSETIGPDPLGAAGEGGGDDRLDRIGEDHVRADLRE